MRVIDGLPMNSRRSKIKIKAGDIVTLDYARDSPRSEAPLFIALENPPSIHYSMNVYCFYSPGDRGAVSWLHVTFDIPQSRLIKLNYTG